MRIVSGIQPTGIMHLGNYLGAVKNWVSLQDREDCFFFVADLHAITEAYDPRQLRSNVMDTIAMLLACGIEPAKCALFIQSHMTEHTELAWLLTTSARMGWLNRMTQFKDKSEDRSVGVGLFAYPILQAADVLLYDAELVPVGEDQDQHLQLVRDLVQKINHDFDTDLFTMPKALIPERCARVMSLYDPTKKMSKSAEESTRINLTDTPDLIASKVRRATTDSITTLPSEPEGLVDRPAVSNLVELIAEVSDRSIADVLTVLGGKGNGALKNMLAEVLVSLINPIRQRYEDFRQDEGSLKCAAEIGWNKVAPCAEEKMQHVRRVMLGFD